jgi:hypothetical protein
VLDPYTSQESPSQRDDSHTEAKQKNVDLNHVRDGSDGAIEQISQTWKRGDALANQLWESINNTVPPDSEAKQGFLDPRIAFRCLLVTLKGLADFIEQVIEPLVEASRLFPNAFRAFCEAQGARQKEEIDLQNVVELYTGLQTKLQTPLPQLLYRASTRLGKYVDRMEKDEVAPEVVAILGKEEDAKVWAVNRLKKHFYRKHSLYPIHQERWNEIEKELKSALRQRSELHGTTSSKVLEEELVQAFFVIASDVAFSIFHDWEAGVRALRRHVNDAVTEGLVGPEWRRIRKEKELDIDVPSESRQEAQIETRLRVDQAIHRTRLTKREAEVIEAVRSGSTTEGYAERRGISPITARVLYSRALAKLRKKAKIP